MAINSGKLKIFHLLQILLERTDEAHAMNAEALIAALAENYGEEVERKTIYSDIETLREAGYDIGRKGGKNGGFYVDTREFELAELKLLVDATQCSKFLSKKKSDELIGKLRSLTTRTNAEELRREVVLVNRPKAVNEQILYSIDFIHQAIHSDLQLTFQYTAWNLKKELVARHDGEVYRVSPWALTWDDENYYLVAYDSRSGQIRHYRVDKMRGVNLSDLPREGKESFAGFDLADYNVKTFGMYGGRDCDITMECDAGLVGVILDRFGQDVMIIPSRDRETFRFRSVISVSPQFYGWLAGIGPGIRIVSPEDVRADFIRYLDAIAAKYRS